MRRLFGRVTAALLALQCVCSPARAGSEFLLLSGAQLSPVYAEDFTQEAALSPNISFSRPSNATLVDNTGQLTYAPNNAVRNSTMQGAVCCGPVGAGGTEPTNWNGSASGTGLTVSVVGLGVESGINYIDIRVAGTTTSTLGGYGVIVVDGQTSMPATAGQKWIASEYAYLVSGSLNNITPGTLTIGLLENNSGGGGLSATTAQITGSSGPLSANRVSTVKTITNTSTAYINLRTIEFSAATGVAIDFTLRIGAPQLELVTYQTSPSTFNPTSGSAYYGPRYDFTGGTANGLLVEEQRTNSLRNSTAQGAVVGTPGTLPTNWSVFSAGGLTTNVIGSGISNGINYVDLQITGTSTGTFYVLSYESSTGVAASAAQAWSCATYYALVGGSLTNITTLSNQIRYIGGAANVTDGFFTPTGTLTRTATPNVIGGTGVTNVVGALSLAFANGAAINLTIRIGLPQLELGAFATSAIPTYGAAVTRASDAPNGTGPALVAVQGQQWSIVVEYGAVAQPTNTFPGIFSANVNGSNFAEGFYNPDTSTHSKVTVGGSPIQASYGNTTVGGINRLAFALSSTTYGSSNGKASVASTPTGPLTGVVGLRLGYDTDGAVLNGYLRSVAVYNYALSLSQLQAKSVVGAPY